MWATIVSSLVLSASPEMTARTLDGREVVGTITELSSSGAVLKTADKPATIALDQLLSLTPASAPRSTGAPLPMRVELVDGSSVPAGEFEVSEGQVTLTVRDFALVGPSKAISVAYIKPVTEASKEGWAKLLEMHKAKAFKGDVLVISAGDKIDRVEGVLHDTGVKNGTKIINFDRDGDTPITVPFERVAGLIYLNVSDGDSEAVPEPVCIITDADGSKLRLKSISLKEGRLEFETLGGFKGTRPIEQLTHLDFSAGKVAYLGGDHELASDELGPLRKPVFRPLVVDSKPLPSDLEWGKPRSRNRVLQGDVLTLGGKAYKRGLYLKGGWEVEYALRGRYRRLQALVGVDDKIAYGAELVVEGDGKVLFKETLQKPGSGKPLDLDVSGVRILKIRANRVPRVSGIGDGVIDLCEAKVSK
jgi:hypothetical protein